MYIYIEANEENASKDKYVDLYIYIFMHCVFWLAG